MRHQWFIASVVTAGCLATSGRASAAVCDTLTLDDDAQDVILGEFGPVNYTFPLGEWIAPTNELGVCWRDVGGAWHLELLNGCDTSTPAADTFVLRTKGGDDYVAPLLEEQTYGLLGLNWIRAKLQAGGIWTHGMECGGEAIAPWNPAFSFGVDAEMGTGADEFHGTPNDDIAASNYTSAERRRIPPPFGPLVFVFEAPGDNAIDMLCGGAGDDELLGDADDDWMAGAEELLGGGPGDDFCDGDPPDGPLGGVGGGSVSDVAMSCETFEDAAPLSGWFSCEDTENPVETLEL